MYRRIKTLIELGGEPEAIQEFIGAVSGSKMVFDFHKILPQPDDLMDERSTEYYIGKLGYCIEMDEMEMSHSKEEAAQTQMDELEYRKAEYRRMEELYPDAEVYINRYRANIDNYGCAGVESWRRMYWGPDDEGDNAQLTGNILEYYTTPAATVPLIMKMATMFPEIEFYVKWSDTNLGHNTGKGMFKGISMSYGSPHDNSVDACQISLDVFPDIDGVIEMIGNTGDAYVKIIEKDEGRQF